MPRWRRRPPTARTDACRNEPPGTVLAGARSHDPGLQVAEVGVTDIEAHDHRSHPLESRRRSCRCSITSCALAGLRPDAHGVMPGRIQRLRLLIHRKQVFPPGMSFFLPSEYASRRGQVGNDRRNGRLPRLRPARGQGRRGSRRCTCFPSAWSGQPGGVRRGLPRSVGCSVSWGGCRFLALTSLDDLAVVMARLPAIGSDAALWDRFAYDPGRVSRLAGPDIAANIRTSRSHESHHSTRLKISR